VGPYNVSHWENETVAAVQSAVLGHLGWSCNDTGRVNVVKAKKLLAVLPGCNATDEGELLDVTDAEGRKWELYEEDGMAMMVPVDEDDGAEDKKKKKKKKKKTKPVDATGAKMEVLFDTPKEGREFGHWLLLKGHVKLKDLIMENDSELCDVSVGRQYFGQWVSRCAI